MIHDPNLLPRSIAGGILHPIGKVLAINFQSCLRLAGGRILGVPTAIGIINFWPLGWFNFTGPFCIFKSAVTARLQIAKTWFVFSTVFLSGFVHAVVHHNSIGAQQIWRTWTLSLTSRDLKMDWMGPRQ